MEDAILNKFRPEFQKNLLTSNSVDGIPILLNDKYLNGDNQKYFQNIKFDFKEIRSAIPVTVEELQTEMMWQNKFYCITFRK